MNSTDAVERRVRLEGKLEKAASDARAEVLKDMSRPALIEMYEELSRCCYEDSEATLRQEIWTELRRRKVKVDG